MDAADRRAVGRARDGDHAGPAACAVVVGEVGVVEQVRRRRVRQAAAAQVGLGRAARERQAAVEDAADLERVVHLRPRRPGRDRPIHARETGRLLEERAVGEPGAVIDQVDRAGALAGREVEAPAGIGAVEMQDAGALLPRRPAREVGAAQRPAVGRRAAPAGRAPAASRRRSRRAAPSPRRGRCAAAASRRRSGRSWRRALRRE